MEILQPQDRKRTIPIPVVVVSVFNIVSASYLLSFNGIPISDDEEFFAGAARNLALFGRLSVEQLYGNLRIKGDYHGVEPAYSFLAAIWYRLFLSTGFGHLQSLYLLSVIYTSLSTVLIVLIAQRLGFSISIGAIAGLLYGLSTMAWPYAKTLFREPLIALLLLASLAVFLELVEKKHPFWFAILLSCLLLIVLALLTLTKVTMGIAGFALFITLSFVDPSITANRKKMVIYILIGILALLSLAVMLGTIRARDSNIFYRFSGTLVHDAFVRMMTISHANFVEALLAPLLSPWKGLFLYSPICLLGFISAIKNIRLKPELFILPIFILITLLLSQALAYDSDWWTPTWGSRFLVPVIPLMTISALPIIRRLADMGRKGYFWISTLFVLGFLFQLPAIFLNSSYYTSLTYPNKLGVFPPQYIWNFANTPIINQWKLFNNQQYDFLLGRTFKVQPVLAAAIICACSILIIISVIWLYCNLSRSLAILRWNGIYISTSLGIILILIALVLELGKFDLAYQTEQFKPLCDYIHNHVKVGEIMIVQPYPGPVPQYLMNNECGQGVWYSLPYDADMASNADARQLVNNLATQILSSISGYWLIEQFWSNSISPNELLITSNGRFRLLKKEYFYDPFKIFIGLYSRR